MSDPDDDRRPTHADGANDEPLHDEPLHDQPPRDESVPTEAAPVSDEQGGEPPVEPGSDESVPADTLPESAPDDTAADRPAVDFGDAPAEVGADTTDFGTSEQQAGDDSLDEPGTPPRTIDIDHPAANDTRPNPMVDAPAVEDTAPDEQQTADGQSAADERQTAAYDRLPAAAAVPPLVEPAPPVEPQRTTPIGTSVPLDDPTPPPTTPPEAGPDDSETTRYPAAAPLPPVAQESEQERQPRRDSFPEDAPAAAPATTVVPGALGREEVLDRQRESYSGFKFGSAFFGAVVMTGIFVILSAIVTAVVVVFGLGTTGASTTNDGDLSARAIVAAVIVAVILFVAAMCGGYVAGRMARFAGVKQGLATWFWGILFAVVVGLYAWYLGANNNWDSTPGAMDMGTGFQMDGSQWWIGVVAIVVVLAVTLLGAIAGGALGMRYHRRVDRAGFEPLV